MKLEPGNVIELANGERYMGSDIKYIYSDSTLDTIIYIRDAEVQGELSDIEKTILSAVYPTYKYIARDEDGGLCLFKIEPKKYETMWKALLYYDFSAFNHLFKSISWNDKNPRLISALLH